MSPENYGSIWQSDHCLPIASLNLLDEIDILRDVSIGIFLDLCILTETTQRRLKLITIYIFVRKKKLNTF